MLGVVYLYVLATVCVLSGVLCNEKLLIDPSTSPYTVAEGTNVMLTCHTRNREGITAAVWRKEHAFKAKTQRKPSGNCHILYGPNYAYSREAITASCNRTSSSIMIQIIPHAEAQNWSCSSGGLHVDINLKIVAQKEMQRSQLEVSTTPTTYTEEATTSECNASLTEISGKFVTCSAGTCAVATMVLLLTIIVLVCGCV